jgi:hypothetical protein
MRICYIDESGVASLTGGTSHFVLVGLSIPAARWKEYDQALLGAKAGHGLADQEIHTAWMARRYPEQERIPGFDRLGPAARRDAVARERKIDLGKAALGSANAVKSLAKNYKKSEAYVHLNHNAGHLGRAEQ